MSKRQYIIKTSNPTSSNPRKRQRLGILGAPSKIDSELQAPQNTPSSSALSTRRILASPPSLLTISISVFSSYLPDLYSKYPHQVRRLLTLLPDQVSSKLLAALRRDKPTFLSHEFLVAHFFRGTDLVLTGALPGVTSQTIHAISSTSGQLHTLELSNLPKISDNQFASALRKLPLLEVLVLRGSTRAGPKTVESAASHCPALRVVNLNRTTPTPGSIAALLGSCPNIEVLKLEAVPNLTSQALTAHLPQIAESAAQAGFVPFEKLISLKLRGTRLNDSAVAGILERTPRLRTLDISFTSIRNPFGNGKGDFAVPALEKLSVTRNPATRTDLLAFLPLLPSLKRLHCGALGLVANAASTLTDSVLADITPILEKCENLEQVNLVGNGKLGLVGSKGAGALAIFIARVGRKCKALNLDNIPGLSSEDLHGLVPEEDDDPPPMMTLTLSNTSIGDEASQFITSCQSLTTLEVANTKFTDEGIFTIIDGCPKLSSLDLTSCRGIRVGERRQFFDVWNARREANDR